MGSFVLRLRLRPEKVRLVTDVVDLLPGEAGTTSEGVPCGLGNEAVSVAARRLGVVAFVALLCYFVVLPVMRLQATAFEDGAAGFGRVFGLPPHRPDPVEHRRSGVRVVGDRDGSRYGTGVGSEPASRPPVPASDGRNVRPAHN